MDTTRYQVLLEADRLRLPAHSATRAAIRSVSACQAPDSELRLARGLRVHADRTCALGCAGRCLLLGVQASTRATPRQEERTAARARTTSCRRRATCASSVAVSTSRSAARSALSLSADPDSDSLDFLPFCGVQGEAPRGVGACAHSCLRAWAQVTTGARQHRAGTRQRARRRCGHGPAQVRGPGALLM